MVRATDGCNLLQLQGVVVLYLAGHDFAVDAADVDAGVEAGLVVGVNDVATKGLVGTGSAVVWSLIKKEMHSSVEKIANKAASFLVELVIRSLTIKSFTTQNNFKVNALSATNYRLFSLFKIHKYYSTSKHKVDLSA